jgi:glucosylceramidase
MDSKTFVLPALSGAIAALWAAPVMAQTTSVDINGSYAFQTIDGFGFSGAFGPAKRLEALCPTGAEPRCAEQREILDLLFSPTIGAGLTILRNQAPSNGDTIEPTNPGNPWSPPTYNWDHDSAGQVWLARQAQAYGVRRFYLDAWSAPGFMKTNNDEANGGTLCGAPGTSCTADWRQAYANYLVQYLQFYQGDGIAITDLGPFNEPNLTGDFTPHYSSMQMSPGQAADFVGILGNSIAAAGFSSRVACCDTGSWHRVQEYLDGIDASASSPWLSVVTGHAYGEDGLTSLLSAPVPRNAWMTEWGLLDLNWNPNWDSSSKAAGLYLAYAIQKGLTDANLSAYFYWQGADLDDECNCLLIHDDGGVITPAKRLWAMAGFSRYIHPGATRVYANSQDSNLLVSAFQNTDGTIAVVALNMAPYGIFTSFAFQNLPIWTGTAAPVVTDSYNDAAGQTPILVQWGRFSTRVPPRALVSYLITPGDAPAPGQLLNLGSNMCMGVPGGSQAPSLLVQWWCNGSADQNWIRDPYNSIVVGGLTYTPWIDEISGLCMGVQGGSTSAGANVAQWPCYPAADQFWAQVDRGGGTTNLVNFASGMCLAVSGGSRAAGAQITQWPCYGPADQRWAYTGPPGPICEPQGCPAGSCGTQSDGCGGSLWCGTCCNGDPCCGDPCCGDPCCGDPCCGDPCCGGNCCAGNYCELQ